MSLINGANLSSKKNILDERRIDIYYFISHAKREEWYIYEMLSIEPISLTIVSEWRNNELLLYPLSMEHSPVTINNGEDMTPLI